MGFFKSLGSGTEVLTRKLREEDTYECFSCERRLAAEHETCPHCGSTEVEAVGDRHRILGMIHIDR
jgi:Zn finger protein HypA/HybF involved in hydrogenase expression